MVFHFGSQKGERVPSLDQSLRDLQDHLAQHQKAWADHLAQDPTAFAQLEPQIHRAFQQLADRCAAGLLAHAAQQPAMATAAQKK
jgi:hypothetical protein